MKYLMRKKGKWKQGISKYIIARIEGGKTVEIRTLPKPKDLWNLLSPPKGGLIKSSSKGEPIAEVPQKFPQPLLTELPKEDLLPEITEEQKKKLWELSK